METKIIFDQTLPYEELNNVVGNVCDNLSLVLTRMNACADFYRTVLIYGAFEEILSINPQNENIKQQFDIIKDMLYTRYVEGVEEGISVKSIEHYRENFQSIINRLELQVVQKVGIRNLRYNASDLESFIKRHENIESKLMVIYKFISKHNEMYMWAKHLTRKFANDTASLEKQKDQDINYYKIENRLESVLSVIRVGNDLNNEMHEFLRKTVINPIKEERIKCFAIKQQAEIDAEPKEHLYTVVVGLGECIDFSPHVNALAVEHVDDLSDRLFEIFRVLTDSYKLSYLDYCKGIKNLDIVFEFYQTPKGRIFYSLYPDKELEEKMTKEDYERFLKTCKKAALDSLPIISKELNKEKTE